ncbi:uncharacterized protein CELE_C13F10.8, partial [Caenorhabditis elegans]
VRKRRRYYTGMTC